jgi:hypothetical protein
MINTTVASPVTQITEQYRLPFTHRQVILVQSDSALVHQEIERMRQAFIKLYGDEFGTDDIMQF